MAKLIRPCTLPAYWKAEEPIEACDIISFGFNWANDSILAFETVWKGQTSKNAYPKISVFRELDLAELEDVKKWIDERYCSSDFESIDKADKEFLQLKYYRETAFLIEKALNAPVKVTQDVLIGLPEDASALVIDECGIPYNLDRVSLIGIGDGWGWSDGRELTGSCGWLKIQSFSCFKTLDYLLQFYTDGTPILK